MRVKQLLQTLATGLFLSVTLSTFAPLVRGQLQTIHSFQGSDGASPHAEVVPGNDGNFYGTTLYGGANSLGTVFKITPGGVLTPLDIFDGSNGRYPQAGLVQGSDGFFYGTTKGDAGSIPGTAFRTTSTGGLTTLATFTSANNGGLYSLGTLIQASDGTFYGTTPYGGIGTAGTVFQLTTGGTLTTVVKFNQSNGSQPFAGLIGGSDGNFYGTTAGGGANNKGTVFQLTPNGTNSVLTTLVSFNGANGAFPAGVLLQTSGGDFYGTTRDGGANNKGTVFKMTVNGTNSTLTTLASFNGANGSSPWCGLVLANDSNFYGTTQQGGDLSANSGYGWGTVFQMTPAGVLTAAVAFNNSNGSEPFGGLVKGTDGNLYGTTHSGGTIGWGTVFKFGTNSDCVSMTSATNKTVECGSIWVFDAPTNIIDNCCTNFSLSFSTVTNGACPQLIKRTWMISDVCGNTNTCSQTVTVVDTTPPVLACATNKTVNCGTAWTFDAPIASDSCSGTNVTITVLGTFTNGICPQVLMRTWLATDLCGNTNTCSQTVTVVDTTPPVLTCSNPTAMVFSAGTTNDNFASPEPAFPSAGLLLRLQTDGVTNFKGFDDCAVNTFFAHTFTNLPSCIAGATLHVRFGTCSGSLTNNDTFRLSFTSSSGVLAPTAWSRYLGNGNPAPGLFNVSWGAGATGDLVLDLLQLPNADGSITDLIPTLNAQGLLDLVLQDDSSIDFAVLTVTSCCATQKTVECGTAWTFDAPAATDSCSGTNVTVAVLSTVTSGVCPMLITRTWQATDACGNASTFSQTVTVVDTTPPALTCATNKTVNCGTAWTFDAPIASDSCSGTNVTLAILSTVTNGICPQVITRKWLAMDACSNSVTCTQTVTVVDTTPPVLTCATNKTVNCATAWTFDAPTASDSCSGTNVTITVFSTTTNGICPQLIKRIWLVTDACTNSVTCTQTVTVVSTSLPVILCPSNIVVTSCTATQLFYTVTATDACNGNLTVICTPPSGSDFTPGTATTVLCLASNCAGSASCSFTVKVQCYTNPCPDFVVNGSFEMTSPAMAPSTSNNALNPTTGVPGWTTASSNSLEIWCNNAGFLASLGTNQLEINAKSIDETVSQVVTGLSTNCPATFSFDYTGRFGLVSNTYNNDFTVILSGGYSLSVPLDPAAHSVGGWTNYSVSFLPTASTVTIAFRGRPHLSDGTSATQGGAHIDNVSLTQCCDTNPCFTMICPTNKVVPCGAAWKFDLPTATSCCSNNVTIISTGFVTNNICPKSITQSWLIIEGCGNSGICSQTVTLLDTQPPIIACPTNRIFVALGTNCQLEIPTIHPPAYDNCTPVSQLVYTQNPPAGTIVPGPCQLVTVTVRDACDNASQCQVLVCGQDKTPPTLIYPKSVTVTNCLVPDVLALVSASDNCTASNQLVFTQSPPAGTLIAAGGNQVSVTVIDLAGNSTTYVIPLTSGGTQSFLDVMFNTGVDNNKVVMPTGSIDPHYTLGPVPPGTQTGPGYYNAPNAFVVTGVWGLPPLPPSALSRWLVPALYQWEMPGFYTYTNQFTLPPGANLLTASLSGRWAADNGAGMYLNGLAPSNQVSLIAPPSGYNTWTLFTANSGFLAFPAVNNLYYVVTNISEWTGVRVEITAAAINCSTCTPPVILLQMHNQSRPLNSVAVFSVSVGGTPPLSIQWYHNGLPLSNGGHYSGVNTPTLTITPLSYADAGVYKVGISNSCGETSAGSKLTITHGWPWWWAWWNFSDIRNPMKATVGPDLIMEGTNIFGISSGTTRDFDLPNIGGQIANVMYVPPLTTGTLIKMPVVVTPNPPDATIIMDVLVPDDSTNPVTLFDVFPGGVSGQDRILLAVKQLLNIGDGAEELSFSGTLGGTPFNLVSSVPLQLDAWNRVAVVMTSDGDDTWSPSTIQIYLYVNGKPAGSTSFNATPGALVFRPSTSTWLFSSPDGTDGGLYAASLQFQAFAFTPEMIAAYGNTDVTVESSLSVGVSPVLSAIVRVVVSSDNEVSLSWTGSGFVLQETRDLTRGVWVDSGLPFDEAEVNGEITTTAHVNPALEGRAKFFKLIYAP